MPGLGGSASNRWINASIPPAEAPIPTMGQRLCPGRTLEPSDVSRARVFGCAAFLPGFPVTRWPVFAGQGSGTLFGDLLKWQCAIWPGPETRPDRQGKRLQIRQ